MELRIRPRHIGDTTPVEFALQERGRAYTIPDGAYLWMNMRLRSSRVLKITKRTLTAVSGQTSAFFTPTTSDVDTRGCYEVQIFGTLAGSPERQFASDIMLWDIVDDLGVLDFSHS